MSAFLQDLVLCHESVEGMPERVAAAVKAVAEEDAKRAAIIEHRRTMKQVRRHVAANRERIDADWNAHPAPPRTIAGHQADVRDRVGEARWAEMVGEV